MDNARLDILDKFAKVIRLSVTPEVIEKFKKIRINKKEEKPR